jgi:hypothetical protein
MAQAQAHSTEEWSHLCSNPLELSSSLRSKRLTEGSYASLALVFKSVWWSLIPNMTLNTGSNNASWDTVSTNSTRATVTQICHGATYCYSTRSEQCPTAARRHSPKCGCTVPPQLQCLAHCRCYSTRPYLNWGHGAVTKHMPILMGYSSSIALHLVVCMHRHHRRARYM